MVSAAYRAAAGTCGTEDTQAAALATACAGLGRSRGKAGIGITETIDDLAALFAAVHAAAAFGAGHGGCPDPDEPPSPALPEALRLMDGCLLTEQAR